MSNRVIGRRQPGGMRTEFRNPSPPKNKKKRRPFWVWVRSWFLNKEIRS